MPEKAEAETRGPRDMTPAGVKLVSPDEVRSLGQFLLDGAERWPDCPWCTTPAVGSLSRADAIGTAKCVAGALRARGLCEGDRIVVGLPNSADFIYAWFGAVLAGVVPVAMNPKALRAELVGVYREIDARLAIVPAAEMKELSTVGAELRLAAVQDLCGHAPLGDADAARDVNSPASYLQSSGSTGRPKLIALSHKAQVLTAESFPSWLSLSEDDVLLTVLPLSHANAQLYSLLGSYGLGAQLILLPRFSASTFWSDVQRYGATQFNAMSAMLEILRRKQPTEEERSHSVRVCFTGPAFSEEHHRDIERRFDLTLVITYGQTEILMAGTTTEAGGTTKYGSSGQPRQHPIHGVVNAARILDPSGKELGSDVVGELEIWSASPTPGYLNMPAETEELFHGGWIRTGDLARRDRDGFYYITGRIKDMIRYKGENLSPLEVETVLTQHADIAAAAVIGVPSSLSDEDIKAFVIRRDGASVKPADLFKWCAERLPTYKVPRYVEFVADLPLTQTNKIAKKQLSLERSPNETDRLAE